MADPNVQEDIPHIQEVPEVEEIQPQPVSNASSSFSGGSTSSDSSVQVPQQPEQLPLPVQWHWILRLLGWLIMHLLALATGLASVVPQR